MSYIMFGFLLYNDYFNFSTASSLFVQATYYSLSIKLALM